MSKPRRLGKTQNAILHALRRHGSYWPGCGWYWTGHRTTVRLLDSLAARGLCRAEPYSYCHPIFGTIVTVIRYIPAKDI